MKAIARCALARRGVQWQIGRVGGRRVSAHYSCMPCFFSLHTGRPGPFGPYDGFPSDSAPRSGSSPPFWMM